MKVLVANKFFFRNGGSEVVMFQERQFLKDSGIEVVDFSMKDDRNVHSEFAHYFVENQSYATAQQERGVGRLKAAVKIVHSREAVRKITTLLEKVRPDILHCHNVYHQLTPSIIGAAKRVGVRVVLTLHDYKTVCPTYLRLREGKPCSECLTHGPIRVITTRCADGSLAKSALLYAEAAVQNVLGNYQRVDAVIAPSEFMRSSVSPLRFRPDRVHVIYNGVDTSVVAASTQDDNYALYVGRLVPEKGIETLLQAHSRVSDQVELRVVGAGPLESEIRARFPAAKFLGFLSGPDLEAQLRNASVIVVPSIWYENCPMSILEAMAVGKSVIGANIGGIPELISDGVTGFLFEPGNEDDLRNRLMRLMTQPTLRAEFGRAARIRAEKQFSLRSHNEALLQLYSNLIDRR
jgi:glycosyltransferase involved in cell wall biosynthesis